jgi:hypothetical protein
MFTHGLGHRPCLWAITPPVKDVSNQVQSIEGLNLNSGANLVIAFNTNEGGNQVVIGVVNIINIKK